MYQLIHLNARHVCPFAVSLSSTPGGTGSCPVPVSASPLVSCLSSLFRCIYFYLIVTCYCVLICAAIVNHTSVSAKQTINHKLNLAGPLCAGNRFFTLLFASQQNCDTISHLKQFSNNFLPVAFHKSKRSRPVSLIFSPATSPELLKPSQNPAVINAFSNLIRHQSTVIDYAAVSSSKPATYSTDDNFDNSFVTTQIPLPNTKLSTSVPRTGFGIFRNEEGPSEDDEDFPLERNINENVENGDINLLGFSNSYDERDPSDNETTDDGLWNNNQFSEGDGFTHSNDSYVQRILIMGDSKHLTLSLNDNSFYWMQQPVSESFEGCFCDHRYRTSKANTDTMPTQPLTKSSRPNDTHLAGNFSEVLVHCYCYGQSVMQVPRNFSKNVRKIHLERIGLDVLEAGAFKIYSNLAEIYMKKMPKLYLIEAGVFSHLPLLNTIYIQMAPVLLHIPDGVFMGSIPKLKHLKVIHSGLEQLPIINYGKYQYQMIDFDNSRIHNITTRSINVKAESVNIEYNQIEFVGDRAFYGSQIGKLSLKGNKKLVYLQEDAFSGLSSLRELDLSQTSITKLPTNGLSDSLEVLRLMDTFTLKEIPFVYHFKNIKEAHLTYSYHCCAFQFPANHNPIEYARIKKLFNTDRYCNNQDNSPKEIKSRVRRSIDSSNLLFEYLTNITMMLINLIWSGHNNQNSGYFREKRNLDKSLERFIKTSHNFTETSNIYGKPYYREKARTEDPFISLEILKEENEKENEIELSGKFDTPRPSITPKQEFCGNISFQIPVVLCYPTPDEFNPCEDVMGNFFLRFLVWLVVIAAVLGNFAVIVVLMSGRFSFNVSKFLMINLAIADLMMGVYLSIIAVVDVRTMGVYFNYAMDWQHGLGCKVAGFITVFATVLSIFTLTVITLERWFAITYAIQLNRRLKLGLAVKVMLFGWLYSIFMASLPLFGISSYSKTSICLPMEHRNLADNVYLISLLSINGLAFVLITACYGKMYISIISQKTRATMNDMTIAKRMALLVFTDFACWAPIAFFGLTAIAGYPFIDVPKSKFLLVTFYPLNSCANPFLYAILTKQYRRDFFILVSRYGLCTKQAMRYKNASARNHLNFYLNQHPHHPHHRRPNVVHESSEIPTRPKKHCPNSNPVSGSVFSQLSCDGQNVHLYKYICKGHHHHHYCAAYHHHHHNHHKSQQSLSPDNNNPTSVSSQTHHNSHHSCSDQENSTEHVDHSEKSCCNNKHAQCHKSKSQSSSMNSLNKSCSHRKHIRCHHMHHQHRHNRCRHNARKHACNNKCCTPKNDSTTAHENTETCCRSAVFSTIDIYPEFSNSNNEQTNAKRHDNYSCENSRSENEDSHCRKYSRRPYPSHNCHDSYSQDNGSSSCEQVQIMRKYCQNEPNCNSSGKLNGRVFYIKDKNKSKHAKDATCTKLSKYKQKQSNPFLTLLNKFSLTKIVFNQNRNKEDNVTENESSETPSPYSSSTHCSQYHYHHHCRCKSRQSQSPHQSKANIHKELENSTTNCLPVEEQREILRQALQETTTVEEAIAVVEELSSGTRMSMGSSSSSKKAPNTSSNEVVL